MDHLSKMLIVGAGLGGHVVNSILRVFEDILPEPAKEKEFTAADQERLDAAQAKRDRRSKRNG